MVHQVSFQFRETEEFCRVFFLISVLSSMCFSQLAIAAWQCNAGVRLSPHKTSPQHVLISDVGIPSLYLFL